VLQSEARNIGSFMEQNKFPFSEGKTKEIASSLEDGEVIT
jgi:hypothetical protein